MIKLPKFFVPLLSSIFFLSACSTLDKSSTNSALINNTSYDGVNERPAVVYENETLKFYFREGTAEIPKYANVKSREIIAAAQQGKNLAIITYDNPNDIKPFDMKLAKSRALAVKNFLIQNGVPIDRIKLMKPISSPIANSFSRFEVKVLKGNY